MEAHAHGSRSSSRFVFAADPASVAGRKIVMQFDHTTAVTWLWVGPDWAAPVLLGLAVIFLALLALPPKA